MHKDAFDIDDNLVRDLIAGQFPDWLALPRRRVRSDGTDNVIYTLGKARCARLPLIPSAGRSLLKEVDCLNGLPTLPLKVPHVLGMGDQTPGYPSPWAIYCWIVGDPVQPDAFQDDEQAARDLGSFSAALHQVHLSGVPVSGAHNHFRGCPLGERDEYTRAAISALSDLYPTTAMTHVWEAALSAPPWVADPVLIHGDLHAGNLLQHEGKLVAVLDFGLAGRGDPAVDCIVAWSLFRGTARTVYRNALGLDAASWDRGKGWALSTAVIALEYYRTSNPFLARMSRRTIEAILEY